MSASKSSSTPNQSVQPVSYHVNSEGHACIGEMDVVELAKSYGTPLYVLDAQTFRTMAKTYTETLAETYPEESLVLYASKANMNMGLCKLAESENLGLDVVSGGELYTAIQAGFPLENVFFNGNNKSTEEIELALHHEVGRITVDNPDELALVHSVAEKKGVKANVLLRVSPGIECHTHDYIKTGQLDSKFGFNLSDLSPVMDLITGKYKETIELKGLHAHIGSQIFEVRPFEDLVETLLNIYYNIRENYDGLTLTDINLGGGLGVAYTHDDDPLNIQNVLETITERLVQYANNLNYPLPRLMLEPGRSMIANAGVTLYTLGSSKSIPGIRKYLAVDGGMGDNIRPALYQAEYSAIVANKANRPEDETVTIAGKYCESGDILIKSVELPATEAGDLLLVFGTGAYSYSMASNYNRVPRPAMILVEDGQAHLLVRREDYEQVTALDVIPSYLLNPEAQSDPAIH